MSEEDIKKMNLYEKITNIKSDFLKAKVKKSGKNKFANYTYYELADITPVLIELCKLYNIFTRFTYTKEEARLVIVNADNPTEREEYTSPMEELELKGCSKIQALGGVETYQRRYLYLSAFDIIENDMLDAIVIDDNETSEKKNDNDRLELIVKFEKLVLETGTSKELIYQTYKVDNNTQMSNAQLEQAIRKMESRLEVKNNEQ